MVKKTGYIWGYAAGRQQKPTVPDNLKKEVQTKGNDLVEKVLKSRYITPPPVESDFNYPIDIWTKWHGSFFYFGSTWASPGPNRIAPTFEVRFARMEYVGNRKFNLAYFVTGHEDGAAISASLGSETICVKTATPILQRLLKSQFLVLQPLAPTTAPSS